MSDDREKLKALLLGEEMAQIKALQKLLDDKQQLSQRISEVLGPAADLAVAENPAVLKKFSKIDPKSYVRAIKANKQTFIDALLPIIGPMIRKSVTSAIRRFVADVNRAVEMGVSAKALKWRWVAFRTGVPFVEIVFNNTIEYQVQQVFLIDNHTGLLVEHVGHEESLLQDKDAMSAMLTAIQDFVKDSVSNDGEGLTAAELGDSLLWLVPGNQVNMAVVIKGAPTQRLHDTITSSTENIHIEFHREIEDQSFWNNSPDLKEELEKLLITKTQSDEQEEKKGLNFWPWLIILFGLLSWWGWHAFQQHRSYQQMTDQLNQIPGFVLAELKEQDDGFIASGLADPLADFSTLGNNISIKSTPFVSLEDSITTRRIINILNDSNLSVEVNNQTVTINGTTDKTTELLSKIKQLTMLPGIKQTKDLSTQFPPPATWQSHIQKHPPPHSIQVKEVNNIIQLEGTTTQQSLDDFMNQLRTFGEVNTDAVAVFSISDLEKNINSKPVNIVNTNNLDSIQTERLDEIIQAFKHLLILQEKAHIKLVSQSDCQGPVTQSNNNSRLRLALIQKYLTTKGINEQLIISDIKQCTIDSGNKDLTQIGVWFEVIQ